MILSSSVLILYIDYVFNGSTDNVYNNDHIVESDVNRINTCNHENNDNSHDNDADYNHDNNDNNDISYNK